MTFPDTLNEENSSTGPAEIEVLISGVTFGPFTAAKARERITEGLLSPTDQARLTSGEDWMTLQEIFDRLPTLAEPSLEEAVGDTLASEESPAEPEPPIEAEPSPTTAEESDVTEPDPEANVVGKSEPPAAPLAPVPASIDPSVRPRASGILAPQGPSSPSLSRGYKPEGRTKILRPGTGPLVAPARKFTVPIGPEGRTASPPLIPLSASDAGVQPGGIRSQILARTSQDPLKLPPRGATPRLTGRAMTAPLSFAPPTPTRNAPPASEFAQLPSRAEKLSPAPFTVPRPQLEEKAEEPEEPVPEADAEEPAPAPNEVPLPPARPMAPVDTSRISPATRSISVAAFATGSLPRPAAITSAAKPGDPERPPTASDAILTVRLPARRTQVIKAMPGAPVKTSALKSDTQDLSEVKTPAESKSFTEPLPAPARVSAQKTPSTLASVAAAPAEQGNTVHPRRRGMGNASALAATTVLASNINKNHPVTPPPPDKKEVPTPKASLAPEDAPIPPTPAPTETVRPSHPTRLNEMRRAALKQARLRRKRQFLLLALLGLILAGLLCAGIYYYSTRPADKIVVPAPKPAAAPAKPAAASTSATRIDNATAVTQAPTPAPASHSPVVSTDPKALAHIATGQADQARGDLDGAIGEFTQATLLDPRCSSAFGYRAAAKQAKGDLAGAIADDDQLLALEPHNANGFCQRGFIKQSSKDFDGAVADYSRAIELDPKSVIAFYNRGMIQEQKGQPDAAIADYNQALDLNPKLPGAYYNRGNAKMDKADLDGAVADYTRALELNPKIALASCNRALAEQNLNNLDAALADYNQALSLDPNIGMAYYNRGLIKEQRGDLEGCIDDSTKALLLDPTNAQAYYNRGVALQAKGNLDAAVNDLHRFSDLAPKNSYADYAHLYLWVIKNEQSRKPEADRDLAAALGSNWNAEPAELPSKLAAYLLDHLSETDLMALPNASDPKKRPGQHCEIWYFEGIKKLAAGNKAAAVDCFQQCLGTNQKDFCEYILAQAQLQTIGTSFSVSVFK